MSNLTLADAVEKYSYMRQFTPEEMEEMRIELAEKSIELKGLQEELKAVKDEYKIKMKPFTEKVDKLLTNLHQKSEVITEECSVEYDQEKGIAEYYNSAGTRVGMRPLFPHERQKTIFNQLREGTND